MEQNNKLWKFAKYGVSLQIAGKHEITLNNRELHGIYAFWSFNWKM